METLWIGRGKRVLELENEIADWVSSKYCVAFGSGTCALLAALRAIPSLYVSLPQGCEALYIAARLARKVVGDGPKVSIYPDESGYVVDYARHLPKRWEAKLRARFGVFSFGALKDVSGGLGGALVSNDPIEAEDLKRLSPMSDINAAMVLSQLDRYQGKSDRLVADGKIWRL